MGKRILFSPVGGTDPIKYFRDGSMLHICRHYRPNLVYLYLSHEMLEVHREDNRYLDAIERLGIHLDHSFEVKVIEREGLINVQEYDVFYEDFREEIRKIEKDMQKGDELLINMASGTPAMKSALLVMATFSEYRFRPVQVATPLKSRNRPDSDDYDVELNWELNEDNQEGAENRCTEVRCLNLVKMLKVEAIKKHIRAYDYAAARDVAMEIQEDISEDAYRMIQIGDERMKLNQSKISILMKGKDYDIYPVKEGNKKKIFEYALVLQLKIRKQELADFIRGITPIVVDLLEDILKKECGIVLKDCCREKKSKEDGKKSVLMWNRNKLKKLGLLDRLDREYKGYFREGNVYSRHIKDLISFKSSDSKLIKKAEEIVEVESNVRNMAAHEIVSVTDEWIRKETGKTSQQILEIIKYLLIKSGINVKDEYWNSYDKMNEDIEMYLDQ